MCSNINTHNGFLKISDRWKINCISDLFRSVPVSSVQFICCELVLTVAHEAIRADVNAAVFSTEPSSTQTFFLLSRPSLSSIWQSMASRHDAVCCLSLYKYTFISNRGAIRPLADVHTDTIL